MTATPLVDRQQLMIGCQGLVRSIAWRVYRRAHGAVDMEELVAFGQVGLAEAARDFDPVQGHRFTTFAWYRVRGAMLDGLSRLLPSPRAPGNGSIDAALANDLIAVHGSAASAHGDRDTVSAEGAWLQDVSTSLAISCLCTAASGSDRADSVATAEAPDEIVIRREMATLLNRLVDALDADSRELIRAAYFEGVTLTEAARRLGISKGWASRLHARALATLAERLPR